MDSRELAAFLRTRRERVAPAEVGLPAGRQRRTPGLRREEVAQLAYISVEYYTRLEQARASRPSRPASWSWCTDCPEPPSCWTPRTR